MNLESLGIFLIATFRRISENIYLWYSNSKLTQVHIEINCVILFNKSGKNKIIRALKTCLIVDVQIYIAHTQSGAVIFSG